MMVAPDMRPPASLRALLDGLTSAQVPDLAVADLSQSAQDITPGGLFLATAGTASHGLEYLEQALSRGALAVVWEPSAGISAPELPTDVPAIPVPDLRAHVGLIADRFFGQPSAAMSIAGITGTNGKTSSAFFIAQAVEALGPACGMLGTLGVGRPGALRAGGLTTPDAVSVHRSLAAFLAADVRHLSMEVSSHALDQGRVNGVRFECAAFTNLSRDHLDYHGDMSAYGRAKLQLFTGKRARRAVINCADAWGREVLAALPADMPRLVIEPETPPRPDEDYLSISGLDVHAGGLTFQVRGSAGEARLHSRLVGDFNAINLLIALGVLLGWGFSFRRAIAALETVRAPAGRMETFEAPGKPLVIVDYAHTPDALEKVLLAARAHAENRLLVVFGCGGERDAGKRPQMGAVASRLADQVVITDDNPRGEDPDRIVSEIIAGTTGPVQTQRDRAAAIASSIEGAAPGDVLVIAGKGHEEYQTTASGRQPFSDRHVVAGLLGVNPDAPGAAT